jgi:uncharacterized protein
MRDLLARIAGWCVERPAPVLAATVLLALVGAVGALKLEADARTDQLVDRGSQAFAATERFKDEFGDDAVAVLVQGDLEQLMLTSDLATMLALEGCLAGNAPGGQVLPDEPAPEPCAEIAESKPAKVVYGPGTFLNQFIEQTAKLLSHQQDAVKSEAEIAGARAALEARRDGFSRADQVAAAQAAAQEVTRAFEAQIQSLAVEYGQIGLPSLDNPSFVSNVVFGPSGGDPKPRFSFLFPSAESALISVRLRPELTDGERREAIEQIRAAVADPAFSIREAEYVVSGVPVLVEDVAESLSGELFLLLAIAVAVMAAVLALFLGPPLRLLPLAIALAAAALTFGGLALLGGSLTLASLACLPVLIGLAVDYAIQFQARFGERTAAGSKPPRAAVEAAHASGPVIGTAALATAAGFCVLLLWPLPVVRSFGLLLLAGIGFAFALSLTAGLAALSLARTPRAGAPAGRRPAAERLAALAAARARAGRRLRGIGRGAVGVSLSGGGRLLAVALAIAVAGWIAGTRTEVVADIRALLPSDLQALEELDELERGTGVSGEIDVTVTADDLTEPEVVAWMADLKSRVLERAGFDGEEAACQEQDSRLCPSIALPDLFSDSSRLSRGHIRNVLGLLPPYFSQAVVDIDPASGEIGNTAVIAFGIKVMPFDEQKELIDAIRAEIDPAGTENDPPAGVTAEVVGLPVLVADASSSINRDRFLLTLGGLLAVALALAAIYRSARRVLVPLIPIVLATGWSSLAIWIFGVDLNPMSATLGALVIAIATEFSVLLAARFEAERAGGAPLSAALRSAYSRTGMAVLASGVTATAGFAVLAASDIPLLRNFGLVTVLDLSVALAGVLVVLPATLVWAEGGFAPFGGMLQGRRDRVAAAPDHG